LETRDIDFAILVPDIVKFKELTGYLSDTGKFDMIEDVPHRVIFIKNGMFIDLIPFGGIEKSGYTHFNDRFDTRISVLGMQEVFKKSVEAHISDEVKIRLATLPGLCILKLLAWNDKPEMRQYDIEDIYSIILNFFDIESDKIYEKHE
jgi:predicted nucleotidyltransferase